LFSKPSALPGTNGDESAFQGSKLKKKVSFDDSVNGEEAGAVVAVVTESPEPTPQELGFLRSKKTQERTTVNGKTATNGTNGTESESSATESGRPEMEQVQGRELVRVPEEEDEVLPGPPRRHISVPEKDPVPGEYWTKPSIQQLKKMSREQLKHVSGFKLGRKNCGYISFDEPVDLSDLNLDEDLFDKIAQFDIREITLYPDTTKKPPVGKGLNVPSTLRIENSWPRRRDMKTNLAIKTGPAFSKHVERLKRLVGTEFISYDRFTGVWTFKVPHYTTYGFDYGEEDDEGESFDQSTLSAGPDAPDTTPRAQHQTPTQSSFGQSVNSTMTIDDDTTSHIEDDTFDFKKRKLVPGSYANPPGSFEGSDIMDEDEEQEQESFLGDGSAGSDSDVEDTYDSQVSTESEVGSEQDSEMNIAGSFPTPTPTAGRMFTANSTQGEKFSHGRSRYDSPSANSVRLDLDGNWAEQLQRTISPRKQDRQALRELQENAFSNKSTLGQIQESKQIAASVEQPGFATSIDLMNSLFRRPGQAPGKKQQDKKTAFEVRTPLTPLTY
jgi:nuclear pore complex protein Nup98-Nup96